MSKIALNLDIPKWPQFSEEEIASVGDVLRSGCVNYWTGDIGRRFEQEFGKACGAQYAVALSNGTNALELALKSLAIGEDAEVVVSPRTFFASASAIVAVGARPVFADIDQVSQNVTARTIEAVMTSHTRAIIVVHLAGWPCEMDSIMALANRHSVRVIEDCAQAHGARYKGRPVGSLGDVAAWSFCQDKIMTTGGEGGMLTTNDEGIWRKAWSYKDHGKDWDAVYRRVHPPGYRWLHENFGTNWRMTEMQAAIGRIQLRKLPEWINVRQRNAAIWNKSLGSLDALRVTIPNPEITHAYYKFYTFVRPDRLKDDWSRDLILQKISSQGIPCFSGSCSEIYLEKAFAQTNFRPVHRLPIARELGETSLMFLVHPTLNEPQITMMAATVRRIVLEATR